MVEKEINKVGTNVTDAKSHDHQQFNMTMYHADQPHRRLQGRVGVRTHRMMFRPRLRRQIWKNQCSRNCHCQHDIDEPCDCKP